MTVGAIARLAVLGVIAAALAACSQSSTPPVPRAEHVVEGGSGRGGSAGSQQPEFHGAREIRLRRGHQVSALPPCVPDRRQHWVCEAVGGRTFAASGRTTPATVTDAVMSPAENHTAWFVRLQFARTSRHALQAGASRAAAAGDFLLALDSRVTVFAPLAPSTVHGTRIRIGPVTKSEAWDLVTRLTQR